MKILLLSCLIFTTISFGQRVKTELMVGETSREELLSSKNKDWFEDIYNSYAPNEDEVKKIKKLLKKGKYSFEIYFGTWCPDSRREVPRIYKILDEAGYDEEKVKLVGVDRDKKIPNITDEERAKLDVQRVPTLIVFNKKGEEVNRYVEYAQTTLEHDLRMILSDEGYKHSYLD
jgi:thiol-disulfide isomerase/thioredoxin